MPAPPNNKYNEKYTYERYKELFIEALENAESNDDILCLEDAISSIKMAYSTYYKAATDHKELDLIRNDTKREILRRVNAKTLTGKYIAAPGIFRMKQLGDKEESENVGGLTIKLPSVD